MSILKNIVISSLVSITFITSLSCYADVAVKGYYRKDGTYVKPHMRSNPDGRFSNNWSTVGNVNPYTGEIGTKTSPIYNSIPRSNINSSVNVVDLQSYSDDSSINDPRLSNPYNSQVEKNDSIVVPDYGMTVPNNFPRIRVNGIDWYQIAESETDIAYIRKGTQGYFNNYPIVSIMYKGAIQPNKLPVWLGTRFMKVIVDCNQNKMTLIADAIVDSNGNVVRDIDYPRNTRFNWNDISNNFDINSFKSTSKVCGF